MLSNSAGASITFGRRPLCGVLFFSRTIACYAPWKRQSFVISAPFRRRASTMVLARQRTTDSSRTSAKHGIGESHSSLRWARAVRHMLSCVARGSEAFRSTSQKRPRHLWRARSLKRRQHCDCSFGRRYTRAAGARPDASANPAFHIMPLVLVSQSCRPPS